MGTEYLTVNELSALIHRSPGAIRNLVLRRRIPYRKVGGRLLFLSSEIHPWIRDSPGLPLEEVGTDYESLFGNRK